MSTTILTTKLHIPTPRPQLVARPRLIERLDNALHGKLTLISAPAGFGKTTLVGEWIAAGDRPVAWLSLEEDDGDPTRFLTYLIAALQTLAPTVGKQIIAQLQPSEAPLGDATLTALLNELNALSQEVILVLDDYHVIDSHAVDGAVSFLLDHLPPHSHLIITTREDPRLPLSRLRARGQITEIRVADLRFTPSEAAAFFRSVMNLELSAEDLAALDTRTEGWVAGLQLAALSMRDRQDVSGFIKAFAGDHRYIVDYLVEEVLERQPSHLRAFLLQTSILDRLSGPLCDAVTGAQGAAATLEALERANLFVVPLDDNRRWYRYHHLFAGVLQARLMQEQPTELPVLHGRASRWYEANQFPADAVRHALSARDFARAANLVECAWATMDRSRQSATWLRWARQLPQEEVRARPVLCAGYAWALLDSGELEAGEDRLHDAQRWLDVISQAGGLPAARESGMIVAGEEEFQALPATVASARAYIALARGDLSAAIEASRKALALLAPDDDLRRGIPAALLALALWRSGDLQTAYDAFSEAMDRFRRAGNVLFAITGTYILADIRLAQGRLRDAIAVYERAIQLAEAQGEPIQRGTADLYLGLSELKREQGDLDAAAAHLHHSEALREQAALPRWEYRWHLAQARIKEDDGDLEGALAMLDEAQRLYLRGPVPDVRPIAALKAHIWATQGRVAEALAWAVENGLSLGDDLSYAREFEHLTLARVLLARYRRHADEAALNDAVQHLQRLLQAAEEGERRGSMIAILVLLALVHDARQERDTALVTLERALALAAPQGYYQTFVGAGPSLAPLLSAAADGERMPAYARRLLAGMQSAPAASAPPPPPAARQLSQPLVEPLSERELEVLELVAQGLSNRQIGERLFLALSTIKGHNRTIFAKLQVRRRTEAVARARELGLL